MKNSAAFYFPYFIYTKQNVAIYSTQMVTIAMVISRLWRIFMIMKDNFCKFTYYIILAHHNSCHSIYHMIKSYYIVCESGPRYTLVQLIMRWVILISNAYVDVIVLKRSCPAVSHICSFTFSPSTIIVRILKSTPIVVIYVPTHKITQNKCYKTTSTCHMICSRQKSISPSLVEAYIYHDSH